jgi:hypothetical protein
LAITGAAAMEQPNAAPLRAANRNVVSDLQAAHFGLDPREKDLFSGVRRDELTRPRNATEPGTIFIPYDLFIFKLNDRH